MHFAPFLQYMLYTIHCFGSQAEFSWQGGHSTIEVKFHYAVQSQTRSLTWTQTCVCVSCACRRLVESWSKASCEPVCDQVQAISTCRDRSKLSATCFRLKKVADSHELVESEVCDLDIA